MPATKEEIRYYLGVDLGQASDPTAIVALRRLQRMKFLPIGSSAMWMDDGKPIYQAGHIERLPLNTPYPGVVRHVKRLANSAPFVANREVIIDYTGVGRPVYDMFLSEGLNPIGVTITGGDTETQDGAIFRVPKINLISQVQTLLHEGRLKIQKELPEAAELVKELQDFRAEVTDSGHWRFGARAGKHDDLVLALAIAVWRAHTGTPGMLAYYRQMVLDMEAQR